MERRYIPENVAGNKRYLGFKKRNLIEMSIEIFILFPIFASIPFTRQARWIFLLCTASVFALINFIGVQGNSPIQAIILMFRYNKLTKNIFSYRRFADGTVRGRKDIIVNGKVKTFSQAEKSRRFKTIMGL